MRCEKYGREVKNKILKNYKPKVARSKAETGGL